ncbi:MAG TPA: hypothetical protein VEB40_15910 [Flavipsychrobacter sp.]|nr:hypothetical protein [Flavipsychrobacter sp.]
MNRIYLLALLCSLLFGSCCRKVSCASLIDIQMHGFALGDVDSVYLITNSGDTVMIGVESSPDSTFYRPSIHSELRQKADFSMFLPSISKVYRFSAIQYKSEECRASRCLWNKDYFETLSSCEVNGVKQTGSTLKIYKE